MNIFTKVMIVMTLGIIAAAGVHQAGSTSGWYFLYVWALLTTAVLPSIRGGERYLRASSEKEVQQAASTLYVVVGLLLPLVFIALFLGYLYVRDANFYLGYASVMAALFAFALAVIILVRPEQKRRNPEDIDD